MTNEQEEKFYANALDWFTHNKYGKPENASRFLYKCMVKGYTEKIDGKLYTIKLTKEWFRINMGEDAWKQMKNNIALNVLLNFSAGCVSSWTYKVFRLHYETWSPEFEDLVNASFSLLVGQGYAKVMQKLINSTPKIVTIKGGDGRDCRISEAG